MANNSVALSANGGYELVTAAGTTLAAATPLPGAFNYVTSATSQTGVILPATNGPGVQIVVNVTAGSSASAVVYPPSAAAQINGGTAGAGVTVAAGKSAIFWPVNSSQAAAPQWIAISGA